MAGKKVIIRTLDIGADKQVDYFGLDKEDNPALGYRAIRICLTRPEIFKTQLRALYRASVYGNLGIMFPMIVSVSELEKF